MAKDKPESEQKQGSPRDSEQAFRAFKVGQVKSRVGQGPRGYGEDSALLFEQAMAQTRMAICLSDPNMEDQPIIFANRAFLELTGYEEEEVLGRNCRFLQGPDTDKIQVALIRDALVQERVAVVEILNYRKNGEAFWNALHIGPIYDDDGRLLYLFGSQWDVTEVHVARAEQQQQRLLARELSHRMKNMFSVINAVVSMVGRGNQDRRAIADEISGRIMALGRAHEATLENASRKETSDLRPLLHEILSAYDAQGQITMHGAAALLDSNTVSMLALTIHELAINSLKYGALGRAGGNVNIEWHTAREVFETEEEQILHLTWVERGGPSIETAPERSGLGSSIIDALVGAADGEVERNWDPEGLTLRIKVPIDSDEMGLA